MCHKRKWTSQQIQGHQRKDMTESMRMSHLTANPPTHQPLNLVMILPVTWDPTRCWIVDEAQIMEMLDFCSKCGKKIITKTPHLVGGCRLLVKCECEGGCSTSWSSSPQTSKRAPDNNVLCSAAIFFTGATYTDIFEWAQLLNLQIPKKTQYYSIQKHYLIPVIHAAYANHNQAIIGRLRQRSAAGERIDLCGDGRSDSPGRHYDGKIDRNKITIF